MLPSSSRVKLNRVALKDVVGLEPAPRRRRVPPGNVRATSGKRGSDPELSGAVSEKDTTATTTSSSSCSSSSSIPGSSEPVRGVRDRVGPDSETGTEDSGVDINRNKYPSPTGLAGSEGSLRRAVTASRCGLCGDSKFISPQQKTLGKQGQKSSSQRPERSMVELKIKRGNPVTETSKKPIVGIDRYLKVTLCDVAQKYDVCGHDFGCVLPDALKTKVVRCFKQDMRAGFRLGPSCLKQDKHKSEESALTKNSKLCPRVQSGKRVCQSQSLNEHKRHLKEHTDAENSSSHTTYHFPEGWPSEASTTCSVSLILGKRTNSGCKTSMWDRNVEEEPGSRAEFYRDKRIKLGDSVKDGRLRSTPDLESINCNEQAKACCISKEKTFSGTSEYSWPCLEYKCGGCSTCRSTVKENCVHKIPYGQIGEPRKNDAAQISSKLSCQRNQADTDELESFTCQRVRVYCRKINSTCARTYLSWPFSNISHTLTAHAGTTALPEEAVRPSARNKSDSPKNQNQSSPPSSQTTDMLPSAPTDPPSDATQLFFCQNEEKQEEKGEHTIAKRNGTRHGTMSSYSSDSKTTEFVAHIMEAEKTLASLVPNTASLSILSQHGKEPGTNTVSVPSTPVNGPETDSSMSTPSPSALGLSDWETATTLSPMSSLFKHGSLSSLSATPSPLPPTFPPEQVKGVKLAEAHSTSTSSTAFSPKHIIKAVEKPLFYCEETQMTLCCSSARASSFSSHNSDSFHSCESSPLLLPQDAEGSDIETFTDMSQSQLEPYYNASACNENPPLALEQSVETTSNDFMLPPLLSPVNSPQGHLCISFLPQKQCCSNEEEQEQEEINKDTRKHKMLPGHHMPQIGDGNHQNYEENPDHHQHEGHSNEELEGVSSKYKTLSSHSSVGDLNDGIKEESRDKTDYTEYVEQGIGGSEQVPLVLKIKANLPSGVLTEPCSPPSSDAEQPRSTRDEDSCPSENAGRERDKTEAVGDTRPGILDECAAYEQDILLVNVIQDDPELFENLPEESVLKLGPTGVSEAPKTRLTGVVKKLSPMIDGASLEFEQRSTPVIVNFHCDSPDTTEESNNRPWRPQSSSSTSKTQNSTWPAADEKTRNMGQSDKNDNDVNGDLERSQPIQTLNSPHNIPPLMTVRNGQWITNPVNMTDFRRQKSNATRCSLLLVLKQLFSKPLNPQYCRQYFSESLSCGFKMCRFQHVPVEGDEKFCVETVTRFIKNPMCLQKAGAVFTGYYQNNPPGVYFSMSVLLSLLQALLKAGMVSDVFSVLSVSLAHKILPGHEFLLALFNFVRENGLMGSVPELMQLTFRMASAGLVLSLDCLDCVKNTPEFHQTVHPNSPVSLSGHIKQVNLHVYHKRLSTSAPPPEYLKFAHSVVEIELCTKQEDWRRMGEVFRSICQSSQHPNQVEQISGRIAIALLSESKDKLSLPFSAFADTVCRCEGEDSLIRSFLGRIGVSLMLRYHKTHQWTKGRRVVEVLSTSKVSYSTLKGLFGNEDGASRCYLVTVATELFLLSGSVEGALNTLRENKWFLSSCLWPCELADLDSRSRVLMRLAEKTSHRDTLEVLCNLPGMKEPNDLIDISRYGPLFNSHLQVCVDRQILSIASDTVDFMLSKNLAVDHAMLQILLLKLGKQNLWLRAREVFRDSLNVGYYPGLLAPPGFMALIVPCRLGEVELALTFEMFISVNAAVILQLSETATSCLSITLKRTQSGESEYLSAGSRLLSAACIPQPKLIVHYKAVNSSQEQVFTLDISSARRWLRHNHLWANEVWTH